MLYFLEETTVDPSSTLWSSLIMMAVVIGIFYFLMIRPENKRKKESEAMRNSVKVGDKITSIGGIVGTIVSLKEDRIVMEVGADQVRLEIMKWAISSNESGAQRALEEAQKAKEAKAKAKAAKKAEKNG